MATAKAVRHVSGLIPGDCHKIGHHDDHTETGQHSAGRVSYRFDSPSRGSVQVANWQTIHERGKERRPTYWGGESSSLEGMGKWDQTTRREGASELNQRREWPDDDRRRAADELFAFPSLTPVKSPSLRQDEPALEHSRAPMRGAGECV